MYIMVQLHLEISIIQRLNQSSFQETKSIKYRNVLSRCTCRPCCCSRRLRCASRFVLRCCCPRCPHHPSPTYCRRRQKRSHLYASLHHRQTRRLGANEL